MNKSFIIFGIAIVLLVSGANALQDLFPDADLNNPDNWRVPPLWSKLDFSVPHVTTPLLTNPTSVNLSLEVGVHPNANKSARHNMGLRVRQQNSGGQVPSFRMKLFDGNKKLFTSGTFTVLNTAFLVRSETLTQAEIDNFDDYSDLTLQIRVTGSLALPRDKMDVQTALFEIPEPLPFPSGFFTKGDGGFFTKGDGGFFTKEGI